jgi:hypothetical protein
MTVANSQGFRPLAEAGSKFPFDRDRFKNLVHYVIWAAEKYGGFGATKLYKVLWFAEARTFVLRGAPLAGAEYIREEHGPVPRLGKVIRDELEREGKIGHAGDAINALVPPDVSLLSPLERQELNDWIDRVAIAWSNDDDHPWLMADVGEVLPFSALMATRIRDELSPEEHRWAKERAHKLGLR